jgi:PTH1 family peptidyl-tRNA hydrolase
MAMKIIIGLGNPGKDYALTRHNVGFWCMDRLATRYDLGGWERRSSVLICQGKIFGERLVLVKPRTFVNNSGRAVLYMLARFHEVANSIVVIYDDLDLSLGRIRVRASGGSGGHNGIKSIIEGLGSEKFARIRIGIGRPVEYADAVDHVLGIFTPHEVVIIGKVLDTAEQAIISIFRHGAEQTMNSFNQDTSALDGMET